ncbi:hypothetical protein E2C01_086103 [Portunus trituberculatus]|uniref:Uncharacterized protein n=1 Tax=Portunus trituberculatus TaxID=210409 RepID=A0A5B7JDQ2_PORTR|nr:hypothetical protein [Portunus trituberculatus]
MSVVAAFSKSLNGPKLPHYCGHKANISLDTVTLAVGPGSECEGRPRRRQGEGEGRYDYEEKNYEE